MANMPFFRVIYTSKRRNKLQAVSSGGRSSGIGVPGASPAQQPRQIFFSRAFIIASSALMVSTYFELSTFEVLAAGCAAAAFWAGAATGTAFSADGAGGAALS